MNKEFWNKQELVNMYTTNGFDISEANCEINFSIELLSGYTEKDLITGTKLEKETIEKIYSAIKERVNTKKPIAQIIGKTFFMGQKFEVNEHTLIPRPETELLVNRAIDLIKQNQFKQILDIGCGSGCISCMIAKTTNAQVLGIDISNEALKVCLNNAMHLDLMNKAIFRKSDLFSKIRTEEKFDLIVSNPPYIPLKEKENLQIEVKMFEPDSALFTKDDEGLEFYKAITKQASEYLNNKGYIIYEVGYNQANKVLEILKEHGFSNIKIYDDVTGIARVVEAKKNF